jgi:hypothetical protein
LDDVLSGDDIVFIYFYIVFLLLREIERKLWGREGEDINRRTTVRIQTRVAAERTKPLMVHALPSDHIV